MATRPSALRAFREALAATSVRSNPAARKKAAESPAALGALSSALREMARRFLLVDPKDVPDADLVAVLLAGAVEGDPLDAATGLLSDVQGNLARVARAEGFARRAGFTTLAQARMTAAAELVKRAERRASVEGLGGTVTGPAEAERIARAYIGGPREQMGALFFDSQLRLLGFRILSMGGQTMTVADPREVVIAALEMRAKVVILVHNHPSGVPSPSSEDDTTTAKLKEILRLLNMQLADHLILGKDYDIYSYALNMRLNPRRANPRRANPRAKIVTERIPKGTVLYHGTNAEEPFEEDGTVPDGPAWFTNHRETARYFALDWHEGKSKDARVLVYEVVRSIPKVARITTRPEFNVVLSHIGLDPEETVGGMEEVRDAMGAQRGLEGWNIHNNYQPGDDILLVSPEKYLRLVRVEPA